MLCYTGVSLPSAQMSVYAIGDREMRREDVWDFMKDTPVPQHFRKRFNKNPRLFSFSSLFRLPLKYRK